MEAISNENVGKAVTLLGQTNSLKPVMGELDLKQPALVSFSLREMEKHGSEFGMPTMMLNWMVFKAFEFQATSPLPRLVLSDFNKQRKMNRDLMNEAGKRSISVISEIMDLEQSRQPYLFRVVFGLVRARMEDPKYDHAQQLIFIDIVFLLKSTIDAFDWKTQ